MPVRAAAAVALLVLACSGCGPESIADTDEVFYDWDGRRVLCAIGLDPVSGNSVDSVLGGLERAAERDEVLMLFAHAPGSHVPFDRLEAVLARADQLGLDFLTARDLALDPGPPRGGLALSFDDSDVDAWVSARELLRQYGAHVSFYVTRFDRLTIARRAALHELAADGHTIEAHGLRHRVAPDYVEEYGLAAYMNDEALPSIELLRAEGFDPVSFAYPHGYRTSEIDDALLEHVKTVRSVTFAAWPLLPITDPCPE
jgi:peptidoglycan/xylan/chitin deacetylase (PgdA/CDA1 family)